jgi:hypothetical protein
MSELPPETDFHILHGPPEGGLLDRLARILEEQGEGAGGDRGEALSELLDLTQVAPGAPAEVIDFYRHPDRYVVHARASAGPWGRCALLAFAAAFRQCCVPIAGGHETDRRSYQVCQRLYLDRRKRRHWDRYVQVDGALRRLFVARIEGSTHRVDETFVLWGVAARLSFDVRVEDAAIVLTLNRAKSSPIAWPLRVQYRTEVGPRGVLRTEGDFRVPIAGIRVRTEFVSRVRDP